MESISRNKCVGIINALIVVFTCVLFVGCMTPPIVLPYDIGLNHYRNNNYSESLAWFKKADAQGNKKAAFYIGYIYTTGRHGVNKNYIEALHWLKKEHDSESTASLSMLLIGNIYEEGGHGVAQDYEEALRWYRKTKGLSNGGIARLDPAWAAEEKRKREEETRKQEERKRQEEQRISEETKRQEEQRKADELTRQKAEQPKPTTDALKPTYIIKSWKFDKTANTANFKIEVTDPNMVFESRGHMMERVFNICRQEYAAAYPGVHSDNIHFSPISEFEDSTMSITVSIYVVRPVRHSYDPATRRGTLTLDIGQKNYQETYRWAIENIGLICSTKSVVLTQGEAIPAGAQFKILKESTNAEGLQEIEFQVLQ